jgi:hypothetical protein
LNSRKTFAAPLETDVERPMLAVCPTPLTCDSLPMPLEFLSLTRNPLHPAVHQQAGREPAQRQPESKEGIVKKEDGLERFPTWHGRLAHAETTKKGSAEAALPFLIEVKWM